MLRATLKDLWSKKIRLFTTGIAVVLGVAFMSGTLVLTDTVGRTFTDLFANVYKDTDAIVRAKATVKGDFGEQRPRLDASLVTKVAAVDGVRLARGDVFRDGVQIVGRNGKALGNPGMGAPTFGGTWNDDQLNPFKLREGRAPKVDGEAVIDRKSAKDGHLHVGDTTKVLSPTPVPVTIVGIATFGTVDSPGGASFAGMTEAAAQLHFGEPGKFDTIPVVAADGVSQAELKARIAKAIDDKTEVITGAEATKEQQDDIKQGIGFFRTALLIFAFVALFVGSFIIYNTFGIIVAQRTKELALFRALGASRRQVLRSVLVEAALVGVVASAIGLALGIVVSGLLKALLDALSLEVPAGGTVISFGTVLTSFLVGTIVTVTSAFFPAWRAARVPPIAAMRDVAIDRSAASRRRAIFGVVTLVLGIVVLTLGVTGGGVGPTGLGVLGVFIAITALGPVIATPIARTIGSPLPRFKGMTGTLARENALRNPKRTSATAAALMIGVALVGFITVFASSAKASIYDAVDARFRADLIVNSGSFGGGGLPTNIVEDARKLPQIAAVSGVRGTPANIDGAEGFITAVDPTSIDAVYDLQVKQGSLADLGDGTIAVQRRWAENNDKKLGDTIDLTLVQGGVQHLVVKMVYDDQVFVGKYFIPMAVYDKGVVDKRDQLVFLKAKDGVKPAEARRALETLTKPYPTAKVQDLSDFKAAQSSQFNVLLAMIYVLLLLAIIIALLGIANTLALSVFERTRELGLLRAVGMTRRQTRSSIRWESVIIALLGTVLGLGIGLFFGYMFSFPLKDQGFTKFSVPVGQLVFISVLAGFAGVIAAIWPARRAARLDILAAIATE
ncbi:MAG: putative transport system permease protein [Actinomycetota bacterium]|jgi:putative ABC transport system permease protein|nr:putative transport system permease protein [Actinomycetota bacterium]